MGEELITNDQGKQEGMNRTGTQSRDRTNLPADWIRRGDIKRLSGLDGGAIYWVGMTTGVLFQRELCKFCVLWHVIWVLFFGHAVWTSHRASQWGYIGLAKKFIWSFPIRCYGKTMNELSYGKTPKRTLTRQSKQQYLTRQSKQPEWNSLERWGWRHRFGN